jgi:hypothetical protein
MQEERIVILNSSGGGIAGTLDSYYFLGQGSQGNIEREFVVVIKDDIPKEDRTIDGKQPSR